MSRFEIVIVGGGMAGLTMAAALNSTCYQYCRVTVVDPAPAATNLAPASPSFDDRSTALAAYTVSALQSLGITSLHKVATAIQSIEVSDQGHLGYHLMTAPDNEPYGYVIGNKQLGALLWQNVQQKPVNFLHSESVIRINPVPNGHRLTLASGKQLTADLVIVCDGGRSKLSEQLGFSEKSHNFNAIARVASVKTTQHHQGRAFERFTANGPIALLPFGDYSALVWTLPAERYEHFTALSRSEALDELNLEFGQRLGRINDISTWQDYPLAERQLLSLAGHHFLALGNTAATLHPVAGQGFNLAIRGIMRSAQCINQALTTHQRLPSFAQLNELSNTILIDQNVTAGSSKALINIFASKQAALQLGRGAALSVLDRHPSASELFTLASMGWLQNAPLATSLTTG